jgi:hypothetical protein
MKDLSKAIRKSREGQGSVEKYLLPSAGLMVYYKKLTDDERQKANIEILGNAGNPADIILSYCICDHKGDDVDEKFVEVFSTCTYQDIRTLLVRICKLNNFDVPAEQTESTPAT